MRISTRARYGLRLMLDLALKHGKGPIFLKEVSRSQEISEKYLGQIIMPLKAAGLVKSFRGAHGGYTLQRDPDKITVREIVATLEGDMNLVECVGDPTSCERFAGCVTQEVWRQVSRAVSETLEAITLADLAKRSLQRGECTASYAI
jgi:Rrf2 family protein